MRIAVCDDNIDTFEQVKELIDLYGKCGCNIEFNDIVYFSDGIQLLSQIEKGCISDIVFLDIEMMHSNGMDVAKKLRETDGDIIIIFVSSHKEYVFDAFRCEALHFLVKPIDKDDFDDCLNRAVHKYVTSHSMLPLKWKFERTNIPISDVLYAEAYRGHIIVHTVDGVEDVVGKLKDMFSFLQPHGFLRIHHGYIVNMQHIRRFGTDSVLLSNGEAVMMSVRKRTEALKIYDTFLQKRKW